MRALSPLKVARLCGVCTGTVSKWIDSGLLRGFRTPGVRGHRRVEFEDLMAFAKRHKFPLNEAELAKYQFVAK